MEAWKSGLKGLATYRPNSVLGSVLSVEPTKTEQAQQDAKAPQDFVTGDANRRLKIQNLPAPVLSSLRWPGRPNLPEGNMAWTYMIDHPQGKFALFVGHDEQEGRTGRSRCGSTARPAARPRCRRQDAVDGHARQRPCLARTQARIAGQDAGRRRLHDGLPPHGEHKRCRASLPP